MANRIETVDQLVSAFGGTAEFSRWLDVVPSTISNWKEQGCIPPGWHLRLYLECQRRELNVHVELLFGEAYAVKKPEDAKPKPRAKKKAVELRPTG